MDDGYVSDMDWSRWERDRQGVSARYAAREARESVRPVKPTAEDHLLQIHALRHENERLVAELERWRKAYEDLADVVWEQAAVRPAERHLGIAA